MSYSADCRMPSQCDKGFLLVLLSFKIFLPFMKNEFDLNRFLLGIIVIQDPLPFLRYEFEIHFSISTGLFRIFPRGKPDIFAGMYFRNALCCWDDYGRRDVEKCYRQQHDQQQQPPPTSSTWRWQHLQSPYNRIVHWFFR